MTSLLAQGPLLRALSSDRALLGAWMEGLRANPTCLPPELVEELEVRSESVLEALLDALAAGAPDPSSDHFRATVRELSFVGGWLAGRGGSPSLAAHYLPLLGEALRARLGQVGWDEAAWRRLEQSLSALVMETYCRSVRAEGISRYQSLLERCTPLLRLPGNVPALLVVGSPSREVLSGLAGRLVMEVARLGAKRVIVDLTSATPLSDRALEVLVDLAQHRRVRERELIFSSAPPEVRRALARALGEGHGVLFPKTWEEIFDF